TFNPAQGNSAACGACVQYASCNIVSPACGATGVWLYSAPGMTLDQVKAQDPNTAYNQGAPRPQCTTCEDSVTSSQDKYNCLSQNRVDPNLATAARRAPIARAQKLLYELSGNALTDAQRADARSLYQTDPDAGNDCGPAPQVPPVPAACPAATANGLAGGV